MIGGRTSPARRLLAQRRGNGGLSLNTAAMIDIVFLLLVYFLLIAEFRRDESGFALDAPAGEQGAPADPFALPEPPIVIRVGERVGDAAALSSDSTLLDGALGSTEALRERSAGLLGEMLGAEQAFVVMSDRDAVWDDSLGVLNALRIAGYERVRMERAQ
jgi:biopolymer transport protein ExbD